MTPKAGIGRVTAAIVAIAAMLPYLTLKIVWMAGGTVGVSDPAMMNDASMMTLNAATFGMDVVGLILALAFTMRWGMRLPVWLVLLPIWVGTGLLGPIVASVPLSVIVEGGAAFPVGGPIAQWVYVAVYASFIGQGIGLTAAFALYARDRWPHLFTTPIAYGSAFAGLHAVIGWGVLLFAVPIGAINLYWAFGGEAGLARQIVDAYSASGAIQQAVTGLLALAAGVGLFVLGRGRSGRAFWPPMVVTWLGAGSMFAWGLYVMVLTVLKPPLTTGATYSTAIPDLVMLLSMLTGLVIGLAGAFVLVERSGGGGVVQPAQDALEGEQRDRDRQPADGRHR